MSNVSSKVAPPEAGSEKSSTISWGPVLAIVFVIVVYFLSQILGELFVSIYPVLHHWTPGQANSWIQNSVWGQFVYILVAEAITVAALYWFLKLRNTDWKAIGWRKPKWSDPGMALLVLPAYYVSYVIAVAVVHAFVPALNVSQAQQIGFNNVTGFGNLVLTFISLVVLPPFVEELLVRGFLYTSLKKSVPKVVAIVLTSAIFASGHLQFGDGAPLLWIAFIDTFILSLFLIYLREKTKGLWASMSLHASKNLIAFASLFLIHLK